MKKLIIINGTMGVGKTTICQHLKQQLNNSVFLDGDWCWDARPFQVIEETKKMVIDNITHVLNNFIHCSAYENIIFCWVMHESSILDEVLSKLDIENCQVYKFSLICDEATLRKHLQKDIDAGLRDESIIKKSLERLPLYQHQDTIKIDVSDKTVEKISKSIMKEC